MQENIKNFCIIGMGLLGASYAMALKDKGFVVSGVDIDKSTLEYALENKIVDKCALSDDESKARQLLSDADAVVLALYPSDCVSFINQHQNYCKKNALITDVCGVKKNVVAQIQGALREDLEFIAAHPMAGKEKSGIKHADAQMFKNANYIVVPSKKNTQRGIDFANSLGKTLGFARITSLEPEKHDEMIAYLSQLTHAIAVSLMNSSNAQNLAAFTGDSFRDLTRIARLNAPMWRELFFENSELLLKEIDAFSSSLANLKSALQEKDAQKLEQIFENSTERRAYFDKDNLK